MHIVARREHVCSVALVGQRSSDHSAASSKKLRGPCLRLDIVTRIDVLHGDTLCSDFKIPDLFVVVISKLSARGNGLVQKVFTHVAAVGCTLDLVVARGQTVCIRQECRQGARDE